MKHRPLVQHRRSDPAFVLALLSQLHAVRLAMQAIRAVVPAAQLVQTDDVGYVSSTRRLRYQADFENERRWLSFDLLAGRVTAHHPLWAYLRHHGATEAELMAFVEAPCPADIIGINAYVTSERFLDHRLRRYPAELRSGNGREAYADIDAERVKFQAFSMRSMASGGAFHRAYLRVTQQSFLEAHELAFGYFGGVFKRLRYDNLPQAVKKILRGSRREETARFIAFRSHWKFESVFCTPGEEGAHEKGGVEGEVGFFRRPRGEHRRGIAAERAAQAFVNGKPLRADQHRVVGLARHAAIERAIGRRVAQLHDLGDIAVVVEENEIRTAAKDVQRFILGMLVRSHVSVVGVHHEHFVQSVLRALMGA